jgi:hypothetical protein
MKKLIGSDVFHGKNLDEVVDKAFEKAMNKIGEFPELDVKYLNNEWVVICHIFDYEGGES